MNQYKVSKLTTRSYIQAKMVLVEYCDRIQLQILHTIEPIKKAESYI